MPRAARERLSLQNSQGPTAYRDSPSPASSSCSCINSSSDSCSWSESTENTQPSSTSRHTSLPREADGSLNYTADSSAHCPQEEKQNLVLRPHEAESPVWDQTLSCFTEMTLEEDVKDKEKLADVPYSAQIEDISTDTDDIKAHLKEAVSFSIEHVNNDYSIYENVFINPDEFRHVIEIYDFPSMFKTDDLLDAFTEYRCEQRIKWVDNTHALGIFSSESAGRSPFRWLFLCCCPEFIQPVKERPRTDCAVARRMVTRALGLQGRGRVQRY
uniref:R3H domain and coiled-coil containing 1 n=1 Tax=Lates calcarifer TaxID=8187 RepID=A0A4W6CY52_LATCA